MSFPLIQPDYNNDFNYPSLTRKDLMYLDTIKSRDFPIKKINQINSKRDWSTNLYNLDIEKSVPKRSNIYTNKIDYINKIDDIDKAQPNPEIILNKPDFILNISDIEKSHPKKIYWNSKRHVNPLNPVYKLPSYKTIEPEAPPKFIRDQIDISDIYKAKPNKLYPMKQRPTKTYDEIKGVHPRKPYERKVIHDSLNCSDICYTERKFRNTNPLDPEYDKPYGGYIEGTKPFLPYYLFNSDNNQKDTLNVTDIRGAYAGSLNYYNNFRYENKERFQTRDIEGAYADTKKYGINTKRCTNPLEPKYQYIGNNEIFDCFGDIINNKLNAPKNNSNIQLSNPLNKSCNENIDNTNIDIINEKFKYNNSNNLAYSHDFYNIPKSERRTRKMVKSLSANEINESNHILNLKNKFLSENKFPLDDNKYNYLEENEKNDPNIYYSKKPFPCFENNHDPTLKLARPNKNNRLDEKLKNIKKFDNLRDYKKQSFALRKSNRIKLNNKTTIDKNENNNEIINNGMGTLYNKLNVSNELNYQQKLDDIINSQNAF